MILEVDLVVADVEEGVEVVDAEVVNRRVVVDTVIINLLLRISDRITAKIPALLTLIKVPIMGTKVMEIKVQGDMVASLDMEIKVQGDMVASLDMEIKVLDMEVKARVVIAVTKDLGIVIIKDLAIIVTKDLAIIATKDLDIVTKEVVIKLKFCFQ